MTGRLNRLVAAIAACAALAACGGGTAWADTADGKTPFDVKAADGTTLDGTTIGLYRIGEWDTTGVEHDKDGTPTVVHAIGTDADDRNGFQVAADGTRTAIMPHGRAMNAAGTAGITVADGTDPLDAAWQLDPTDSRVDAFARAYARELNEAKAAPDATLAGAGSTRLDPGVYIAMRGDDADTATLAATAMADGGTIAGRNMGSVTLTGTPVKTDDTNTKGIAGLLGRAKQGILSLFGLNDGIAVQDIGGSAGINGYGGGGGSGMEWRWWFQDTKNRDGNAENVALQWSEWNKTNPARIRGDFDTACDQARQDAVNRHGHDKGYYRIVAVGTFLGNSLVGGGKTTYHGDPGPDKLKDAFWAAYNGGGRNEMQAATSDRNAYLNYVGGLADNATNGPTRIACVVLGRDEPGPPDFSLNVSTTRTARNPAKPSETVDYRENDKAWLADTVNVTATGGDWPNGGTVNVLTQLCYDPTPDGINADGTLQDSNSSDRVCWDQRTNWTLSNGLPKGHTETFHSPWFKPDEAPQGMTMASVNGGRGWAYGRYWFYVEITAVGKTDLKGKVLHYGYRDPKEGFTRTYVTAKTSVEVRDGDDFKTASDGMPTKDGWTVRDDLIGTTTPIRDHISLAGSYPVFNQNTPSGDASYMYNQSRIRIDQRLCYRPLGSTDATSVKQTTVKRITLNKSTGKVNGDLSEFTPSDLGMDTWLPGEYWFNTNIPGHLTADGKSLNDDVPTGTDGNVTIVRTFHETGLDVPSERFMISQPKGALSVATKAVSDGAARAGKRPVHDSITLTNTGSTAVKVGSDSVSVTLNYPGESGRVKATKKVSKALSIPAGKSVTVSAASPEFVPADLGMKDGWHANIRSDDVYWFDVSVDPSGVTDAAGNTVLLSGKPSHDGRTDKAEQFKFVNLDNQASTKAADTFARPGGKSAVHDDITLDFDEVPTLNVESTLNWSADANASKADKSLTKKATLPAKGTSVGPSFAPADLGMTAWKAGKYWYDLSIPAQVGCPSAMTVKGLAANQAAERWTVSEPTAGITTKTDAPTGLTDLDATAVHDTVTAVTDGYPAGSTFDVTLKLNYRSVDGSTVRTQSATFKAKVNGDTKSPDFTPGMFDWKTWHIGRYWFDLTAVDPNGKTITVPGSNDPNEQYDVSNHTTRATLAITTRADKGTAAATNDSPVHDAISLASTGAALNVARVHVRLNYPKADGTTATAVKDTGAVKVPANGTGTVDSPEFTPADLGMNGLWADNTGADDHYWFDVWVDKADVTLAGDTGILRLTGDLTHEGSNDDAERFRLDRKTGRASTRAADTFDRAGGANPVHDTLLLDYPDARTLTVKSTLHYAADDTAVKADSSKSRTVTVTVGGSVAGPEFTPADLGLGWKTWKAGKYWYDLDIPAQAGYDGTHVDGLTDKAEQWTAVVPFTLDLAKRAVTAGGWSKEPVKGATFTLTETTDGTGSTVKPGTKPWSVSTDANGSARLLDDTIGATGERWFRLAETGTPDRYEKPAAGSYWMIHVTGGRDGATVTAAGSDDTAVALLGGVDGSTVTIGNRLTEGVIPPMTGGSYDVMRVIGLAGGVTLLLLAAGIILVRRRGSDPIDHAHAR